MERFALTAVLLALLPAGVLAADPPGAAIVRLSGTIVAIDEDRGTISVEEIGPSHGRRSPDVVRRTVAVTPWTWFTLVARGEEPVTGFVGDFRLFVIGASDVMVGDYVTAECLYEGRRLTALKVTIAARVP